jgi:hypothetical protein
MIVSTAAPEAAVFTKLRREMSALFFDLLVFGVILRNIDCHLLNFVGCRVLGA